MTRTQIISVIVALVISTSIASAAWWLVFTMIAQDPTRVVDLASALAVAVAVFTTWYSIAVGYNALRREVWL
jgi:hypothetical protein